MSTGVKAKVENYFNRHPLLRAAARTAGYGGAIMVASRVWGRSSGLIPAISSLSAGYMIADHYTRRSREDVNYFSHDKKTLKYITATLGMSLVLLSESPLVIGNFLLSVLSVLAFTRTRFSSGQQRIDKVV
jgi:hypothetical protein